MTNVGNQLSKLYRHDEALDLRKKVFEKRSRIQGDEHPDTLNALINLAYMMCTTGRPDDARQNASQCLPLARKIGDEETAARCVDLLSMLDDIRKHNESTSAEQRRLLGKIVIRKIQAGVKTEAARLKAATAQPTTKETSVDELMAQWVFDDDDVEGGRRIVATPPLTKESRSRRRRRGRGRAKSSTCKAASSDGRYLGGW
jgi:hypothetical protein